MQRFFKLANHTRRKNKKVRTVETEDYEDDDDDSDDTGGEDIAIEEDTDDEKTSSTTESPEKVELRLKMKEDEATVKSSNVTLVGDGDENDERNSCTKIAGVSIERLLFILFTFICVF